MVHARPASQSASPVLVLDSAHTCGLRHPDRQHHQQWRIARGKTSNSWDRCNPATRRHQRHSAPFDVTTSRQFLLSRDTGLWAAIRGMGTEATCLHDPSGADRDD
jgi:hypothetical protein